MWKTKYLGDIVSVDSKIDENNKFRKIKGDNIADTIGTLTKEISFGQYTFEVGLTLINSLLINGIMYSMEALVHLKKFHVDLVEQCDKKLMQILFNSPRTVPIEAYYIESSTYPLQFHIKFRKFMYLGRFRGNRRKN